MDKTAFENTIYRNWAKYFGCPEEITRQPGTTLHPEEKFRGEKIALVCSVGQHTFIRLNPELLDLIGDAVNRFPASESVSAAGLSSTLGTHRIQSRDRCLIYYLDQHDLPEYSPPEPFIVRQLTLADAGALDALKANCTALEVDDGFVEVDHQIAFGCFAGENMAAASSGYERTGFMDIGVLTHSAYRRKGLGKAVVGALCKWSFEQGHIPQYRHVFENINSSHVAKSLNFKKYAEEESIWLK